MTWPGVLTFVFYKSPVATSMIFTRAEMFRKKIKQQQQVRRTPREEVTHVQISREALRRRQGAPRCVGRAAQGGACLDFITTPFTSLHFY